MRLARPQPRRAMAFTLVEMILAIGIVVGLLIVAMLFYRQAEIRHRAHLVNEELKPDLVKLDRAGQQLGRESRRHPLP